MKFLIRPNQIYPNIQVKSVSDNAGYSAFKLVQFSVSKGYCTPELSINDECMVSSKMKSTEEMKNARKPSPL